MTTLREYHKRTKHSPASVRASAHGLDWDNQPIPFKVYPDLDPIALPTDLPGSQHLALEAIAGITALPPCTLDVGRLAHVLYFSAGVLRRRPYPGGEVFYRAAACTGALYHVDAYVVCGDLDGLAAGVHHFGPHDFALRTLRTGDHRAPLVAATGDEPHAAGAPVLLVLTSTFWRNTWKYRTRTYRHCFWDAGTLLANLLAVTTALGVPAHVVTGFVDDDVARLLDIDQTREAPLAVLALGTGGPPAPPASALPCLGLATLPLSREEIDYPLIREAHAASALATAPAVRAGAPPGRSRPGGRRWAPTSRSSRCGPPPSRSPSRPSSHDADRRADSRARPSRSITSQRSSTSRHVPCRSTSQRRSSST